MQIAMNDTVLRLVSGTSWSQSTGVHTPRSRLQVGIVALGLQTGQVPVFVQGMKLAVCYVNKTPRLLSVHLFTLSVRIRVM